MYYSSTSNKYIPLNVCDKIDIKIKILLVAGLSQLSRVFFLLCISLEFGYICHFSKNSAGRDGRRQGPKRWGVEPWKWRTCVKGDSWESERAFHCQTSEPLLATRQRFRLRRTVTYADRYMHVPRKKTQAVVLHATKYDLATRTSCYCYQLLCTVRISRAQQVQVAVRCRQRGSRCLVPTSIHMCVYVYDSRCSVERWVGFLCRQRRTIRRFGPLSSPTSGKQTNVESGVRLVGWDCHSCFCVCVWTNAINAKKKQCVLRRAKL